MKTFFRLENKTLALSSKETFLWMCSTHLGDIEGYPMISVLGWLNTGLLNNGWLSNGASSNLIIGQLLIEPWCPLFNQLVFNQSLTNDCSHWEVLSFLIFLKKAYVDGGGGVAEWSKRSVRRDLDGFWWYATRRFDSCPLPPHFKNKHKQLAVM